MAKRKIMKGKGLFILVFLTGFLSFLPGKTGARRGVSIRQIQGVGEGENSRAADGAAGIDEPAPVIRPGAARFSQIFTQRAVVEGHRPAGVGLCPRCGCRLDGVTTSQGRIAEIYPRIEHCDSHPAASDSQCIPGLPHALGIVFVPAFD